MDNIFFLTEMLLLGIATGIISASLGLGGGIVMVPGLLHFVHGMDIHTAKGTSLFIIIFVSALNAWQELREDPHENWRLASVLALGSVVGGYVSGWATGLMPDRVVAIIFVVFLGVTSYRTFRVTSRVTRHEVIHHHWTVAVLIGLATGIVSGATGTGGGAVLAPLALMAGLVSNERVVVLSNTVMVATAIAAAAAHFFSPRTIELAWTVGQVNVALGPIIFLGALIGSPLGRRLNKALTLPRRRVVMGCMLILVAVRLLYEAVK